MKIPLSPWDYIELRREFEAPSEHSVVAHYADTVRKILEPKLASFDDVRLAASLH